MIGGNDMNVDLLFKIAGVGILVSIINIILNKSGRDEHAMLTTIMGLIIVLLMVAKQISGLFSTVKTIFDF